MSADASHPTYAVMALMAVKSIKSFSKGASRPAIKAYVKANNKVGKADNLLREALTKLVASGAVTRDGQRFLLSKVAREAAGKKKAAPKKEKASTKKFKADPAAAPATDGVGPSLRWSSLRWMEVDPADIASSASPQEKETTKNASAGNS
jgi:hypothetical protein